MSGVTFTTGGVHPPEGKDRTSSVSIVAAPIPDEVIIPLSQHIGPPAKAAVGAGGEVTVMYPTLVSVSLPKALVAVRLTV